MDILINKLYADRRQDIDNKFCTAHFVQGLRSSNSCIFKAGGGTFLIICISISILMISNIGNAAVADALTSGIRTRNLFSMRQNAHAGSSSLIIDTDVGFDDIITIKCLLLSSTGENMLTYGQRPSLLTTVEGMNLPDVGASFLQDLFLLESVVSGKRNLHQRDRNKVRLVPAWLVDYRETFQEFMAKHGTNHTGTTFARVPGDDRVEEEGQEDQNNREEQKSLQQIVNFMQNKRDKSIDLLCLGPLTNIAHWSLVQGPLLQQKIRSIWIMGGNFPRKAEHDMTTEAEFNFAQDPSAAAQVLNAPFLRDKIHIVTADESSSKTFSGTPDGLALAAFLNKNRIGQTGLLAEIIRSHPTSIYYDPFAAFAFANCNSLRLRQIPIRVDSSSGRITMQASPAQTNAINDESCPSTVKFVSGIDVTSPNGFIHWMETLIEKDGKAL